MKKKKKLKLPLTRILDNNRFMLRLIQESAPGLLAKGIVVDILDVCQMFVFSTLILQYAINSISEGKNFEQIVKVVVLCTIFGIVTVILCAIYDEKVYKVRIINVKKDVYRKLYHKASEVELKCYENPEYYDRFVKAIDECGVRADELIETVRRLIMRVITFLLNGTLIVTINPFLMIFAFIPLMVTFAQAKMNKVTYQKKMEILEEERNKDYTKRVFYLNDYAKEMRLTEMSPLMLQRFKESGDRIMEIIKKHGITIATLRYLVWECRYNIAPLGATFCAVWQAFVAKTIGYGDCLVIINSIDRVSGALSNSSDELMKFQECALYIENLRSFLEYEPELKSGEKHLPEKGDLVLEHVSFRYDGAAEDTLHDVTMKFGAKERIAIVGHNGAGKTTLVKLLLRLYDANGSITYGGTDIKELNLLEYRDMFSAVMQDFHVFALSVADNVRLDEAEEEDELVIERAIEKSGLSKKLETFENGINTLMTKEFDIAGEQMSGGEQQKLAISHVYYRENRFVILDEPSSALDPIAEYEMYNRMIDACKDCGMIFISHRLASAVLADRIYLMEQGKVAECGSHDELMKLNGKYADMFRRQAENYLEGSCDEEEQ